MVCFLNEFPVVDSIKNTGGTFIELKTLVFYSFCCLRELN